MAACKTRIADPLAKPDLSGRELPGEPVLADMPVARSGPIRILRLGQVIEATGLGKSKIYELQATGNFPMRVQITSHCVGWVEEEIQMWLAHRIASRPSPRSATIGKIRRTRESCAIRSRAHAPVSGGSTGTVIRYRGSNLPSLTSERLPLPSLIRLSFSFARQGCLARSAR